MFRIRMIVLSLCLTSVTPGARSTELVTAHTLRLGQGESPPPAKIDAMAWYAGTWRGAGLGGENEEIWSAPEDGSMMGMYRLIVDNRPVFYEFLTLVEENESLILRLKHFHPDLQGWEKSDESVDMPLVAVRDGRLYFDGLTFEPRADGSVTIYLAIKTRHGAIREEVFKYQRQRARE